MLKLVVIVIVSAITYIIYNFGFYRMAADVLDVSKEVFSWKKIIICTLVNFCLMFMYSRLQVNLMINWFLMFLFFYITSRIIFKKNRINTLVVSMVSTLIGLSANILMRCLFAIGMNVSLEKFNNDILKEENFKHYPVITAFLVAAIVVEIAGKTNWKQWFKKILKQKADMKLFMYMLIGIYLYQISILLLFYTEGNSLALKLWGVISAMFSFVSVIAITKPVGRSSQIAQYSEQNYMEKEKLRQEQMKVMQLEKTALTDSLTGCYNRIYADDEISSNYEKEIPFIMCLADMDGLKEINDFFGHESGDKCLKLIGHVLKKICTDRDVAVRYGGDEFVLIFYNIDMNEALNRMTKSNEMLMDMKKNNEIEYKLTVSFGLAHSSEAESGEKLYEIADNRMYTMKKKRGKQRTD